MNRCIIVLLIVLFSIAANNVPVFGRSNPPCTDNSVPKVINCPTQPSYDCSSGLLMYKLEKQWVVSRPNGTLGDLIIPSSPGAPWAFQLDFIVATGATCGGRSIQPSAGVFGTQRVDYEAYVTPGPDAECYREFDCDWVSVPHINGYKWQTVNPGMSNEYQMAVMSSVAQYRCDIWEEATSAPFPGITTIPASWFDCYSGE